MLEVLQGLAKRVWVQACAQTHSQLLLPSAVCYCLGTLTFHTSTSTASHSSVNVLGGAFFYVLCYSEFPSAFTWLVVVKIMLGPWDLTQCREDVEFCQPGKYVWLFFFSSSSAAFIFSSSCVVSLNWVYLTEILSIFCMLLSFRQTV